MGPNWQAIVSRSIKISIFTLERYVVMKQHGLLIWSFSVFILGTYGTLGQDAIGKITDTIAKNDSEALLMHKFEPDYLFSFEERRAQIKQALKILDTMDISDRKRRKLLKEIFKTPAIKTSKNGIAETLFENQEN